MTHDEALNLGRDQLMRIAAQNFEEGVIRMRADGIADDEIEEWLARGWVEAMCCIEEALDQVRRSLDRAPVRLH